MRMGTRHSEYTLVDPQSLPCGSAVVTQHSPNHGEIKGEIFDAKFELSIYKDRWGLKLNGRPFAFGREPMGEPINWQRVLKICFDQVYPIARRRLYHIGN